MRDVIDPDASARAVAATGEAPLPAWTTVKVTGLGRPGPPREIRVVLHTG